MTPIAAPDEMNLLSLFLCARGGGSAGRTPRANDKSGQAAWKMTDCMNNQMEKTTMPNWCENTLEITGPQALADDLRAFMTTATNAFDFEAIIPPLRSPDGEDAERLIYWCNARWGTKWNAEEARWLDRESHDPDAAHVVNFFTAWSPPLPLVWAISARFPALTLRLSYDEPGLLFRGFAAFANGELLAAKVEDYEPPCD